MRTESKTCQKIYTKPPIVGCNPHTLILGTMHSVESLRRGEYYGHPQNAFWKIFGRHLGFERSDSYDLRTKIFSEAGYALWDVLGSCRRKGSLDSAIVDEEPNDIDMLLKRHPSICTVAFNGKGAEKFWKRHCEKMSKKHSARISFVTLPSTSPAYATLSFEAKFEIWEKQILKAGASRMPPN
eukprot:Rmarinus@m.4645